jgi:hypothetical protein
MMCNVYCTTILRLICKVEALGEIQVKWIHLSVLIDLYSKAETS